MGDLRARRLTDPLDDAPRRTGPPVLVLLTGPPGTGKSTLAEVSAEWLQAPVFGHDWAIGALTPFDPIQDALQALDHPTYRRVGWSLLWQFARAQLRAGRSVVLDGVARDDEVAETRILAAQHGARCVVVLTSSADPRLHRARMEGRQRGIPGWPELDWANVAAFCDRWEPPADVDLMVDASDDLEANIEELLVLLRPD